jgi:glyoxylase-like metal-dependent hydrolase (beta-lactamase superfamily II)
VAAELGIGEVELAEGDMELYNSPENSFMPYFRRAADLPPGRTFKPIPGVKIVPLPGHTQGGTGFLFTEANGSSFLISGDTIFSGSIGRTDLPGGNYGLLINSIRSSILALPEETVIYPGHGSSTNVAFERVTNPFLS